MEDLIKRGFVCYEDFGAVGDGVTDDFEAIYKAHAFANENKLKVLGTPDKTYYIFDTTLGTDTANAIVIKTDVDWRGAHFIIDDRELSRVPGTKYYHLTVQHIFSVEPEEEHKVIKIEDEETLARIAKEGINPSTERINLGIDWDGPVMVIPYNSSHKVFRRRGYGQYAGEPMHEVILLEADGRVSEETPIMFDYKSIDYIDVYRLDESSAITIENGIFTTLDSRINHLHKEEDGTYTYKSAYIARGLKVTRSYTTVNKIEHRVEGGFTLLERAVEKKEGSMYAGFFVAIGANHVTFRECIMPGRIAYGASATSSYNFSARAVNKIVLERCVQSNFWVTVDPETFELKNAAIYDPTATGCARRASDDAIPGMSAVDVNGVIRALQWGIGGTNYCKNMEYINSTLSRFDAHAGLYNGKIINSNISGMELTGVGEFLLRDSAWYPYGKTTPMLYLRADYGYHWDGEINVENLKCYLKPDTKVVLAHHNNVNWYYGYLAKFPNIKLDNVSYRDSRSGELIPEYEMRIFNFREDMAKMHLDDSGKPAYFAVLDEDGDGYIDEPIFDRNRDGELDPPCDLDGDGRVGNTSLKYEDWYGKENYRRGAEHPTCTVNLNRVQPPKYFKVINNKCECGKVYCKYLIKDTSLEGISDGDWYRASGESDTMCGYFGKTEFVYDGGSFIGTKDKNGVSESFVFEEGYFVP